MNAVEFAIESVGGQASAAKICGVLSVSVHVLVRICSLPRTDYTKKTKYAEKLSAKSAGKFTSIWLLENANPDQQPKVNDFVAYK